MSNQWSIPTADQQAIVAGYTHKVTQFGAYEFFPEYVVNFHSEPAAREYCKGIAIGVEFKISELGK